MLSPIRGGVSCKRPFIEDADTVTGDTQAAKKQKTIPTLAEQLKNLAKAEKFKRSERPGEKDTFYLNGSDGVLIWMQITATGAKTQVAFVYHAEFEPKDFVVIDSTDEMLRKLTNYIRHAKSVRTKQELISCSDWNSQIGNWTNLFWKTPMALHSNACPIAIGN